MRKIIILLCLATIGMGNMSLVFAEGWVLWEKNETIYFEKDKKTTKSVKWEIKGAVPKFEQCLKHQQETWIAKKAYWNDPKKQTTKVDGRKFDLLFITVGAEENEIYITENLMCLPSPLDPREKN